MFPTHEANIEEMKTVSYAQAVGGPLPFLTVIPHISFEVERSNLIDLLQVAQSKCQVEAFISFPFLYRIYSIMLS